MRKRAKPWANAYYKAIGVPYQREIIFQNMFLDAARLNKIETPIYGTKVAANYSLLYALQRIICELTPATILDVGAGQSTLLINALAKTCNFHAVTLENDEKWRGIIAKQVSHEVKLASLEEKTIRGHTTRTYDLDKLKDDKFQLVLIDGPSGTKRKARWGSLEIFERHLADQFVIIFDDVNRYGEMETVLEAIAYFNESRIDIGVGFNAGIKSQAVLATRDFIGAIYL